MPDSLDFSGMSDAELEAIVNGGGGGSQPRQPAAASDYSGMSDAELEKIAGGQPRMRESTAAGLISGAAQAIPFSKDVAAGLNVVRSQLGGHPYGVPEEGTLGEKFTAAKRAQENAQRSLSETNPYAQTAGMLGGTAAMAMVPGLTPAKAGLMTRAAAGAGEGALYGLGEGVTPEERLANAKSGALWGAGLTGAIGAAGAAGRGIKNTAEAFRADTPRRTIAEALQTDIAKGSERLTQQELEDAAKRGQPILPVDVGGHTLAQELRTASNVSPEAEATIYTPLKQRHLQQQTRYEQHLQDVMGHDLDAAGMQEDLRQVARDINKPAYRAAYDSPNAQNIWNEDLQRLVQAPAVRDAIKPAIIKAQNKAVLGEAPDLAMPFIVDEAGNVTMKQGAPHNLEFWDNVKQAMDDKIGSLKRAGDSSWGDLNRVKNKLVQSLDNTVPEYSKAREGAAMMFGADNAFDAGLNFLGVRGALNASRMKLAVSKMKPEEREVFAHGVAADMMQKIRNKQERLDISKMFDSPEEREKLSMALGSERMAQFEAFHRVENIMERAYNAVVSNSTTAKQYLRSEDKSLGRKIIGGLPTAASIAGGAAALGAHPIAALLPILAEIGGVSLKHFSGKNRMQALEEMGQMLVSPDPTVRNEIIGLIASNPPTMKKLRNLDTSLRRFGTAEAAQNDREERAKGGRVYPAKRLNALEKAARKAFRDISEESKPIMKMPDEHVAHALTIAKDK